MKKRITLLAYLACFSAHAEFMDGNELLSRLKSDGIRYNAGIGYVMGVFDATHSKDHCPPANVTAGQVGDMVKNHLEAAPQARHLQADIHVSFVLNRVWPCKKGPNL